ncbi:39S ribosomal protein L12, mitochondrial-like [Haliotis rufescens]|uniref:39S ribosomal protein L12, mitochondrial-like n=1 Tax=Haliotis rufescens TaxID=6454 RepID=UPI00201F5BF8|nr:39S ribosomal protein L12, mitochondrial-like [Haliotis rufescens]
MWGEMLASRSLVMASRLSNYCRRLVCRQQAALQALPRTASVRACSAGVIPPPQAEGTDKQYPPKIQKIVEEISGLTLFEVADLNELLKKNLNISDTPMMAMGASAAPAAREEEEEEVAPKREKMAFAVKLVKIDMSKKIQVIKEIKNLISGMNLVQAKKFVDSLPQVVKADIPKDEAEKLKETLIAVGGEVEID